MSATATKLRPIECQGAIELVKIRRTFNANHEQIFCINGCRTEDGGRSGARRAATYSLRILDYERALPLCKYCAKELKPTIDGLLAELTGETLS